MSVALSARPLSMARALRELDGDRLGGVVVFAGRVRPDRTESGPVVALDYEADPALALDRLRALEREARRRFGARRVVLWHRVGRVPVGGVAVIVGVATPHRAPAFAATQYLIDALKATVPIWKTDRGRSGRRRRPPPAPRPSRSAG